MKFHYALLFIVSITGNVLHAGGYYLSYYRGEVSKPCNLFYDSGDVREMYESLALMEKWPQHFLNAPSIGEQAESKDLSQEEKDALLKEAVNLPGAHWVTWHEKRNAIACTLAIGGSPEKIKKKLLDDILLKDDCELAILLFKYCTYKPQDLVDDRGRSYLFDAGSVAMAELLIDHGADVFQRTISPDKNTLLHLAAWPMHFYRSEIELLTFYIQRGLDVNAKNRVGSTPILECCKELNHKLGFNRQLQKLKILLEARADVNVTNNVGYTVWWYIKKLPDEKQKPVFNLLKECNVNIPQDLLDYCNNKFDHN